MSDFQVIRSEEDRKTLIGELQSEFEIAEQERVTYLLRVDKWKRQREAQPDEAVKNYPFKNSSNVCVPVTGSAVNTIFASEKSATASRRPLIDVKATDPARDGKTSDVLQRFLDIIFESKNYINVRPALDWILYDNASLGTQFVKVPWETEKWAFKRRDPTTGGLIQVSKTVRDTPTIIPVAIEDYLTRTHYWNPQTAPWYSTITHLFKHELQQRVSLGLYDEEAAERVLKAPRMELRNTEHLEMIRQGLSARDVNLYDVYETHHFYDVDDDGFAEDVILWIHPTTGEVLREDFNDLGKRDMVRMTYLDIPRSLYGMGLGWMGEHMQDEVNTLHNAAIDSTHFAIMQMLAARKGCGIGPNEEMRPGKILLVDDPVKDLRELKFPDVSASTVSREYIAREYVQRFMGATDYMAGQESSAIRTRATVGGTMFLAQQGKNQFDAIVMENIGKGMGEIAELVVFQLVRNKEVVRSAMSHLLPPEDWPILDRLLDIDPEDIPQRFTFTLSMTDAEQTEEAKRAGIVTLSQLYMNFGQQMAQVYNMAFNPMIPAPPQVRELMMKFIQGGTKMMERILRDFGYDDTKPFVPDIRSLELMNEFKEAMTTQQVEAVRGRLAGAGQGGPGQSMERRGPEVGAGAAMGEPAGEMVTAAQG